jgi:nickel transport system permease protein
MFLIGILGSGMTNVIIAIVLTHWAWYSRIIRSIIINLKNRDYVLASKVAGTGNMMIIIKHFLPAIAIQIVILASMDIGHMILHVSGLSFLGMGIQPPTPEWGVMINDGRQFIRNCPQLIFFPGAMIFLAVMAFNLLGDALRDYLDPSVKEKIH